MEEKNKKEEKEKVEKEKNEIVEEFFRRNDQKNIKSMNDIYTA